ncbi:MULTISPECIES: hypothetical protein [unclassified Streptomyces]|uniref:hypothetical protein n=1 Tax=unclassified Streptomyces TaxID=2593676 RepID=UPI002E2B7097|nr:hypothetical protein [Streptomyces sp. NBC_01423]
MAEFGQPALKADALQAEPAGHHGKERVRSGRQSTVLRQLTSRRAVAPRYDERGHTYLGTVTAAALVIWLRT